VGSRTSKYPPKEEANHPTRRGGQNLLLDPLWREGDRARQGKNAIEVGTLEALPGAIDTLIQAVQAGELDEQLMAAAAQRGQLLRKRAS
jgi:hypothetical protein